MKNKLTDLNDHLFAQLERLGDEALTEEGLTKEVERSKAISAVAKDIVGNAKLVLDVEKFKVDNNFHLTKNPVSPVLDVNQERPAIEVKNAV